MPPEHVHMENRKQWTFCDVINVLVPTSLAFLLVSLLGACGYRIWDMQGPHVNRGRAYQPCQDSFTTAAAHFLIFPTATTTIRQCSLVTTDVLGLTVLFLTVPVRNLCDSPGWGRGKYQG